MKAPKFKTGQQIVLPDGLYFVNEPEVIDGRLYTIDYHIWKAGVWYVVLQEFGALKGLIEYHFRAATKKEINAPF